MVRTGAYARTKRTPIRRSPKRKFDPTRLIGSTFPNAFEVVARDPVNQQREWIDAGSVGLTIHDEVEGVPFLREVNQFAVQRLPGGDPRFGERTDSIAGTIEFGLRPYVDQLVYESWRQVTGAAFFISGQSPVVVCVDR